MLSVSSLWGGSVVTLSLEFTDKQCWALKGKIRIQLFSLHKGLSVGKGCEWDGCGGAQMKPNRMKQSIQNSRTAGSEI